MTGIRFPTDHCLVPAVLSVYELFSPVTTSLYVRRTLYRAYGAACIVPNVDPSTHADGTVYIVVPRHAYSVEYRLLYSLYNTVSVDDLFMPVALDI
jgi:hypothetical protein